MSPIEPPARPKLKPCGPVVRAEEFNHWREAARAVDAAHQYLKSMQELAQAAYEQEKQRGFLEGREAGAREAAQVATNLAGEATRYLNEIERAVPSMITIIVERILGAFDETEFVTRAVRQAVTTLAGSDICLRVAPGMVEPLRRALDEDATCDARALRVEADAGIRPGDCQIVTQAGNIDVGLAAQSRALRNDLQQRLSAIEIAGSNWQRAS
jgi:type III secretion protein L